MQASKIEGSLVVYRILEFRACQVHVPGSCSRSLARWVAGHDLVLRATAFLKRDGIENIPLLLQVPPAYHQSVGVDGRLTPGILNLAPAAATQGSQEIACTMPSQQIKPAQDLGRKKQSSKIFRLYH